MIFIHKTGLSFRHYKETFHLITDNFNDFNELHNFADEFYFEFDNNLRQSNYDCGAYATWAALLCLKSDISIEYVKGNLKKTDEATYPGSLCQFFKKYNYKVSAKSVTNNQINYLIGQLAQEKPVILLVKKYNLQHFILLIGYSGNNFYVYDPYLGSVENFYTPDLNFDKPGNITLSASNLLEAWHGGGMLCFYRWYAISIGVKK